MALPARTLELFDVIRQNVLHIRLELFVNGQNNAVAGLRSNGFGFRYHFTPAVLLNPQQPRASAQFVFIGPFNTAVAD